MSCRRVSSFHHTHAGVLGQRFSIVLKGALLVRMVHQRKLEAARELYGLSPTDEVAEAGLGRRAKVRATRHEAVGGVATLGDPMLAFGGSTLRHTLRTQDELRAKAGGSLAAGDQHNSKA